MGNRHSVSSIEFVNHSEIPTVEVTVGTQAKVVHPKGMVKFEILEATPTTVRGFDKSGRLIHELKFNLSHVASSQVWKITNSGVKYKRSPFFTETQRWHQ